MMKGCVAIHKQANVQKISSFSSFLRAGARDAGAERYSALLAGLSSPDDSEVLINVQELVNMLLHAANEEALAGLDASKFVPVLLNLLGYEHNGEIMLLAVRCLCQMMDQMPRSSAALVACGAVEAFCNKLIMITYVDVAEECIKVRGCSVAFLLVLTLGSARPCTECPSTIPPRCCVVVAW